MAETEIRWANRPTLAEIRETWPATVDVSSSARAFGCSRASAYEHIRAGSFPARTLSVGGRLMVVTASIVAVLEGQAAA